MRIGIFTDPTTFAEYDSLYSLFETLAAQPGVTVDIIPRSAPENARFFDGCEGDAVHARRYADHFSYETRLEWMTGLSEARLVDYDGIWLRMDQPVSTPFLKHLATFEDQLPIANRPSGILETGSKEFLVRFPNLIPGIVICRTVEDVLDAARERAVVYKPARGYGGQGIVRVDGDVLIFGDGSTTPSASDRARAAIEPNLPGICMDFLPGVSKGDKRIIVSDGEILGAVLRVPREGSWLSNLMQGASIARAEVDENERKIVEEIHPHLAQRGILLYGVDTLVGHHGHRVLSEINVVNVGGIVQLKEPPDPEISRHVVEAHVRLWSR